MWYVGFSVWNDGPVLFIHRSRQIKDLFSNNSTCNIQNRLPQCIFGRKLASKPINLPLQDTPYIFNWIQIRRTLRPLHKARSRKAQLLKIHSSIFCWMRWGIILHVHHRPPNCNSLSLEPRLNVLFQNCYAGFSSNLYYCWENTFYDRFHIILLIIPAQIIMPPSPCGRGMNLHTR